MGRPMAQMSLSLVREQPLHRHLQQATRIRVSGVWAHSMTNPGQYARSRYGPGYLRHAQSWRHEGLANSFDSYQHTGGWKLCNDPRFHGCLEKYPTDGNVMFHQDFFTEWKAIDLEP